jgi:hypothetical protein
MVVSFAAWHVGNRFSSAIGTAPVAFGDAKKLVKASKREYPDAKIVVTTRSGDEYYMEGDLNHFIYHFGLSARSSLFHT